MLNVTWFSTGKDEAARMLFQEAMREMLYGELEGRILITRVFCNRERGETCETDRFLDLVETLGVPLICLSSNNFRKNYKGDDWHRDYDREVMKLLEA